jgi:hypothetical protein
LAFLGALRGGGSFSEGISPPKSHPKLPRLFLAEFSKFLEHSNIGNKPKYP